MKCENSIQGTRCSLEKDHAGRCLFLDEGGVRGLRRLPKIPDAIMHLPNRPSAPDFDVKKINECNALKGEILELKALARNALSPIVNNVEIGGLLKTPEITCILKLWDYCK